MASSDCVNLQILCRFEKRIFRCFQIEYSMKIRNTNLKVIRLLAKPS